MGAFKYVPPREVAERHRAAQSKTLPRGKTQEPRQRNVEAVLSLGSTRYFTFQGRVWSIAPVPWKLGQQVLELYIDVTQHAKQVALAGKSDDTVKYYKSLSKLIRVMSSHIQPAGKIHRLLKRWRLMKNPFKHCSDLEIMDITNFFLQGRMKSSVQSLETHPARSETPTS